MPAEVDGSGAVLDGMVEGHGAGAGQVDSGLLAVTVQHWTRDEEERGRGQWERITAAVEQFELETSENYV